MRHKRVFAALVCAALLAGFAGVGAYADDEYAIDTMMPALDEAPVIVPTEDVPCYDPETGEQTVQSARLVLESSSDLGEGWYAAAGEVELAGPLTVTGHVDLTLRDGAVLRLRGLEIGPDSSLTLWSETAGGMGMLEAARQA